MGTSVFLIHTQEGMCIFENIRDQMEWIKSDIQKCQQSNLQHPTKLNPDRISYLVDFYKYGINYVVEI